MLIDDRVKKLAEKAANAHLFEVMGNKGRYLIPDNFSTVQYMNARGHIDLLKLKEVLLRDLVSIDRNAAYLNVGVAAGHLEYVNKLMKSPIHISSVEWDDQYECCEGLRRDFGVTVHYRCNNVLEDDFEIRGIKTYFDYAILERFFPVYRSDTHERTEMVLKKFKPYAKRALVVDSRGNWSKEQWNWLEKVSEYRRHISGEWHCFSIKLENL